MRAARSSIRQIRFPSTSAVNGLSSVVRERALSQAAYPGLRRTLTQNTGAIRTSPLTQQSQWLGNGVLPRLQTEFRAPLSAQIRFASTNANEAPKKEESKSEEEGKTEEKKEESTEGKEGENSEKKGEEKDKTPPPPPPPHGDKSPFAVFYETLQQEFSKSQEWQEGTKAIAAGAQEMAESEAVKKAKAAYSTTAEVTSKVAGKTGEVLKTTATVVGKGAAWTWDTEVVKAGRTVVRKTAEGVDKATKPVRETKAYKTVATNIKETVDDGASSRYGGYIDREERRRLRELREAKELKEGKRQAIVEENAEAGEAVTLHKDAKWKEQWREFRDNNKAMQSLFSMKSKLDESENPVIATARNIADRFAGFFAETETARVIKKIREMDPTFQLEPYTRELREYILPEVLDAYVTGNLEVLQQWLSAAQFSVYSELAKQYTKAGLVSAGRVLDIRNVDIANARMLEPGDIPVFLITCRAQEVHVYKNKKTGKLAAGMEDHVQMVTYVIGMTRLPEEVRNPETMGWRIVELQKQGRDWI